MEKKEEVLEHQKYILRRKQRENFFKRKINLYL
jgi:hypothetical protein